jgi:hypothetical protein
MTDDVLRPGDVRITNLGRRDLNERFGMKPRPTVLIAPTIRPDGHWLVVGLTTNPRYADGTPRTPFRDFPFTRPSYWGSEHAYSLPADQILHLIGRIEFEAYERFLPPWYPREVA